MALASLHDLLVEELRDIYHAERQLLKALPKMAKGASTPRLQQALQEHLTETEQQVDRLERAFGELDQPVRAKKCRGMEGIVEEGREVLGERGDHDVKDAAIIAAAQRVEHYEIAAYGTVCTYARTLGYDTVAKLLEQTLEEEKAADKKLTELAESGINQMAVEGNAEEGEQGGGGGFLSGLGMGSASAAGSGLGGAGASRARSRSTSSSRTRRSTSSRGSRR
jgi:ferritin-like metal-binding protein YciE